MQAALYCADPTRQRWAQQLAQQFGLSLIAKSPEQGYWLELGAERLALLNQDKHGAVYAEFVQGAAKHRREQGGGRGQPVAKAIGLKGANAQPQVVDATAGLGRDSFVLASLGCHVTLIERSPIAAALLCDALHRAAQDPDIAPIAARMRLVHADAITWLSTLTPAARPEVVLLDPMFPESRKKNTAVKKEMQAFQSVIGDDDDGAQLLEAALHCAKVRVVVKRPRLGEALAGPAPSAVLSGKSTRFDLYIIKALRGTENKDR